MRIIFTRSKKWGSRLIRWVTGEDISHVALLTDDGVIVHARFDGVDIDGPEYFAHTNYMVRQYKYVGSADTRVLSRRALMLEGYSYDKLAFFSLGFRLLLLRTFGLVSKKMASYARKHQYICTEFVDTIIGEHESNGQLTPGQLEQQIRRSPQWKQC
jgi:hypothetical protein